MKKLFPFISLLLVIGCIPYKIAPNIDDYKIVRAEKFKRDLPEQYAFVFEDDHEAGAFKQFVHSKYAQGHENPASDIPFVMNGLTYSMSFHEREKTTETVNFFPLIIDGFLTSEGYDPILEESYATGNPYWYVVITVMDSNFNDCLAPTYTNQKEVILYLRLLKLEYQNSQSIAGAFLKE